ncbi:type II secretion system F family protein [Clostridium aminobutyricum]|uniref:Type II secretion system protein GspF domain-containing protein n=1 Tax=Clostridium aminobutyricum TaxID=33953 RepID=A0A939D749_CLOAM|nr:hypothetical protein [Clostridium aminobutyricum]MBN7772058.1 hypothetical protein [Clostridium aminobutyricum]
MQTVSMILIETTLYGVFFIGWYLIYNKEVTLYSARLKMHCRLKARKNMLEGLNPIENHFEQLTRATIKIKGRYLMLFTISVFVLVLIVGFRSLSAFMAFLFAVSIASIPYILLRIRLETIRRKSSFEGEILISNFLNQYRVSNFNIYEALEKVISESKNTKISNKLILQMLLELRGTANPKEIKKATDKFNQVIHTNWARMFSYNVRLGAEKGINVSMAIEDILIQLREARMLYEERKRLNSEAVRIVVYLIPILYLFTLLMSVRYIGINLGTYIHNQFFTKEGFILLTLSVSMFLFNIALIEIVGKQKFDF